MSDFEKAWTEGWPKVVAKAWADPEYRDRLINEPHEVIAEAGLPKLEGVDVVVVEGSGSPKMTLSLPPAPKDADGTDLGGGSGELSNTETSCCC